MNNLQNILRFAMRMEKDAADFYSFYAQSVDDEEIAGFFEKLAETEKEHYSYIAGKYNEMGYSEPPISLSWVVDDKNKAIDPHILSDNSDIGMLILEKNTPVVKLLRMAYMIENDFAEFYKYAMENIPGAEEKSFLKKLSLWEETHRDIFREKYFSSIKLHWERVLA